MQKKKTNRQTRRITSALLALVLTFSLALLGCSSNLSASDSTGAASSDAPSAQADSEQTNNSQADENDSASANANQSSAAQANTLDNVPVIQDEAAYTVYELPFQRGDLQIYGNLYLPKTGTSPHPVVVLSHGFGGTHADTAPYAQTLAENGIASYVYDFCGGSPYSQSEGDMQHMSVLTERADLLTVLDGIRTYQFADDNNIFLAGQSQGGLVSALVAAERPDEIRAMTLLYPALSIPDDARARYTSANEIPDVMQQFGMTVGRQYYTDVLNMDVYQEIGSYPRNVLIIHGSDDSIVPISYSQRATETYASAQLITLQGAGHGFYGSYRDTAANDMVSFLQQNIQTGNSAN